MIPYIEKTLQHSAGNKAYFTFSILFKKLFKVDIYWVCLILLLMLLLLNIIAFANSLLKLKTFVRITVVVHESGCLLRLSAIMKRKRKRNNLNSPLSKRPSEISFWELNEMRVWDKNLVGFLKIHLM